jgi:hypothetical protein
LTPPAPKPLAPEAKPVLGTERKGLDGPPLENKVVPVTDKKIDEKKDGLVAGPAAAAAAPEKPGTGEPKVKSASATPEKPDTTVDVKGKKVEFPDTKTAALATELGKATPGNPASLADAATKAGLVPPVPGQDPGQQVSPPSAKAGDLLVAGDRSYMLLGNGEFLDFSNGKVVDTDQLPKDLGPKGGYFHLQDAGAGAQPGPVSGQTPDTTTFAVSDPPKVPVDAGADVATVGGPPPGGGSPVGGGAPPGGPPVNGGNLTIAAAVDPIDSDDDGNDTVTSAGSPGVPSQGSPGSGPANAAATDTGRGTGTLTSGQRPLDPSAIK